MTITAREAKDRALANLPEIVDKQLKDIFTEIEHAADLGHTRIEKYVGDLFWNDEFRLRVRARLEDAGFSVGWDENHMELGVYWGNPKK